MISSKFNLSDLKASTINSLTNEEMSAVRGGCGRRRVSSSRCGGGYSNGCGSNNNNSNNGCSGGTVTPAPAPAPVPVLQP